MSSALLLFVRCIPHLDNGREKEEEGGRVSRKYLFDLNLGNMSEDMSLGESMVKIGQEVNLVQRILNVQEARLLATCLVKGGSQCGLGALLLTILSHACHGRSHIAGCSQKKIDDRSDGYVNCTYSSVLRSS